ncbi:MAG TPA: ankyrin repeat domain-containing protein [Thermoanaerobaculia bacterium]|nr:ankyrin repeat domain-containing protein [Thermoanaerobaculia bacterium]
MGDLFAAVRAGDVEQVREILEASPESAMARDSDGATALHYAAEIDHRAIVVLLLDAGAAINARDARFHATPAGWAIEYLRQRGAVLGIEIEDAAYAIARGDADLVRRYVTRLPALINAEDARGTPLKRLALESGNEEIKQLFV